MPDPAELRAGDLVNACSRGSELGVNVHARHGILLETHRRNEEAVDHVLSADFQLHRPVGRRNQGGGNNIVATRRIAGIDAQRIALLRAREPLRVNASENAIRTRVAEVPLELRAGDLDSHGVCLPGVLVYPRPQMTAGKEEPEEDDGHSQRPADFETEVAAPVL